jgi:predicted ATPase
MAVSRVWLHGPPSSGKSTLIKVALGLGFPAVDLEGMSRSEALALAESAEDGSFIGGANLADSLAMLRRSWPADVHVQLYPPPSVYWPRRLERDSKNESKTGQNSWYELAFQGRKLFDFIDDVRGSPTDTLMRIREEADKWPARAAHIAELKRKGNKA